MFVPFVFNMSTINNAPYLWWFYKGLDFALHTNSAVIAQEVYCNTPISVFVAEGRREAFDETLTRTSFFYNLPKNEDLKKARLYRIPDNLINYLIEKTGSITDTFCRLLSEIDARFVRFLSDTIDKIETECEDKIEGFITLMDIPSLREAAEMHNIPVIQFELGCWREPTYMHTAFWDLEPLYGGSTVEKRWKRFCEERKQREIPLFSKKECLALLLQKQNLNLIEQYDRSPTKKVGVVLGYTTYELITCKTHLNDSELLYRAKNAYGLENLLIRKHPGDPYGGTYPHYSAAIDKQKRSTPEFILDCETIISLMSGAGMEAMLFNRKAITLLQCPSYYASGHQIEGVGRCVGDDFISYFAFCYLIPLEYLMDVEYIRWRLTMPTEREIYFKHLEFYFQKKGIPKDLILKKPGERLEEMLAVQGFAFKEK